MVFNMPSLSGKTVGTASRFEPVFDIPATTATIEITGVQVEVSPTGEATPFEQRSFGDELQRCLRYYNRIGKDDGASTHLMVGAAEGSNIFVVSRALSTPMRAVPSVTIGSGVKGYTTSGGVVSVSSFATRCARDIACISVNVTGTSTLGQAAVLYDSAANGYIEFDAEL